MMDERAEITGWAVFAGVILIMVGFLDLFYGLAGIVNDEVIRVGGEGAIIIDITAWGWFHFIVGIIMVLAGVGLFAGAEWARWTAVFFALVSAIGQIGLITAFPLWSILIVALDVLVIYNLTARWEVVPPRPSVREPMR
jgi:hypothetical protein